MKKASKAASAQAWRRGPDGLQAYRQARATAQAAANADGFDRGLEWNDCMKCVSSFMLPRKHNRYGHETTCEVVSCANLARTQPGHGPCATRPPSLVGPDHHGGPFDFETNRSRAATWHAEHPEFDADFRAGVRVKPAGLDPTRAPDDLD